MLNNSIHKQPFQFLSPNNHPLLKNFPLASFATANRGWGRYLSLKESALTGLIHSDSLMWMKNAASLSIKDATGFNILQLPTESPEGTQNEKEQDTCPKMYIKEMI